MADQPDLPFGTALPPITPRPVVRGYARRPGTGPEGQTCGTCANVVCKSYSRNYYKCGLVKTTGGPATDIRLSSPACELWKKKDR